MQLTQMISLLDFLVSIKMLYWQTSD